jgi:hypothetical protein
VILTYAPDPLNKHKYLFVSFRFKSPTEVIEIIPSSNGLDSLEIHLDTDTTDASGTPEEDFLKIILQLEHLENRTTDGSGIPEEDLLKLQQQLERLENRTADGSGIPEGELLKLQQQLKKHLEISLGISPSSTNLTLDLGNIPEGVEVILIPVNGQNDTEDSENNYNFVATVDEHGKVVFPELPLGSKFKVVIKDDR